MTERFGDPAIDVHDALFLMTAGTGKGERELWIGADRHYLPAADRTAYRVLVSRCGSHDLPVWTSAMPRGGDSHCLWVRGESGKAVEVYREFEPEPTLVLKDGDTLSRTIFWWLDRPLSPEWLTKANERLAKHFGTLRRHARPEFLCAPPEALTGVQARPQRVIVEELRCVQYHPDAVVGRRRPGGRLQDAPDPHAWREREKVAA